MKLSKSQEEAMKTIQGQVILISCPGSGKTSTVIRRVEYMVEQGIPSSEILVLTFSKAAAVEMGERYQKLRREAGKPCEPVLFATIHSFCFNVLRQVYRFSAENILRETDGWMIVRKGLDKLRADGILKMDIRDPADFTSSCMSEISIVNNNGVDWNNYRVSFCPTEEFHAIYNLYQDTKRNMGKLDFDDMLTFCYELFQDRPDVLDHYKAMYKYLIIDEFQDTNFLQRDILYLLAGNAESANLCVVGDDDQSIYKFRGSRPEIMLNFSDYYPNCKKIYMDVNYRSEPEIIHCAKQLICHNKKRFAKDIKPFRQGTGKIEIISSPVQEENKIVDKILEMSVAYAFEDMAVLYRNNSQASFLAMKLMGRKIPFHSSDRIRSPYRHWIFTDLMAFYNLAEGIGTNQNLISVINKPQRWIPEKALRYTRLEVNAVIDSVAAVIQEPWKRNKAIEQVSDFFMDLKLLKNVEPGDFIDMVMGIIGYQAYLISYAKYRNTPVDEFMDIVKVYKNDIKNNDIRSMEEWKKYAQKINAMVDEVNNKKDKSGVTLSTMHKSKGLEWKAVFLMGSNEGIIPSPYIETAEELEEERRLFYVATTRAKEYLCISYVEDKKGEGKPSRFVDEFLGNEKNSSKKKAPKFKKGQVVEVPSFGKGTIIRAIDDAIVVKFDQSAAIRKLNRDDFQKIKIVR